VSPSAGPVRSDPWTRRVFVEMTGAAFLGSRLHPIWPRAGDAEWMAVVLGSIQHPLVTDTVRRLGETARGGRTVVLTHLNNSSPVLDDGSPERTSVLETGFQVARVGQR